MLLFLKILGGMANSVDPDQTAPEGFVRNFGVGNLGHLLQPRTQAFYRRIPKTAFAGCMSVGTTHVILENDLQSASIYGRDGEFIKIVNAIYPSQRIILLHK